MMDDGCKGAGRILDVLHVQLLVSRCPKIVQHSIFAYVIES